MATRRRRQEDNPRKYTAAAAATAVGAYGYGAPAVGDMFERQSKEHAARSKAYRRTYQKARASSKDAWKQYNSVGRERPLDPFENRPLAQSYKKQVRSASRWKVSATKAARRAKGYGETAKGIRKLPGQFRYNKNIYSKEVFRGPLDVVDKVFRRGENWMDRRTPSKIKRVRNIRRIRKLRQGSKLRKLGRLIF